MYGFTPGFWGYQQEGLEQARSGARLPQASTVNRFFERFSQIPEGYDSPFAQLYNSTRRQGTPAPVVSPVLSSPLDEIAGYASGKVNPTPNPQPAEQTPQLSPYEQQLADLGYIARPGRLAYMNSRPTPERFSYTPPQYTPGEVPQGLLAPNGYRMNTPSMGQGGLIGSMPKYPDITHQPGMGNMPINNLAQNPTFNPPNYGMNQPVNNSGLQGVQLPSNAFYTNR